MNIEKLSHGSKLGVSSEEFVFSQENSYLESSCQICLYGRDQHLCLSESMLLNIQITLTRLALDLCSIRILISFPSRSVCGITVSLSLGPLWIRGQISLICIPIS